MDSQSFQNEHFESGQVLFNKPGLLPRIQATFIDTMIIIGLMYLVVQFLSLLSIESAAVRVAFFFLIVLYEPLLITFDRTVGQRIMGLKVYSYTHWVKEEKKGNIPFIYALVRFTTKVSLGWLSLLTIHIDSFGRAIHDKIADSLIVKE